MRTPMLSLLPSQVNRSFWPSLSQLVSAQGLSFTDQAILLQELQASPV